MAVLGTLAWSAEAHNLRAQATAAARAGVHASGAVHARMSHHELAVGFSRGYVVSAAILELAVIVALAMMRVRRVDLSSADPIQLSARRRRRSVSNARR